MGTTEITWFIVFANVILLVLLVGILLFTFQYRKRKILHEQEKKRIDEEHKLALLNTQLKAQDETMQFIGREIHDSVAQKLTLATIYTQKLEYEGEFPQLSGKFKEISSVINDSLDELRSLSRTLASNRMLETSLKELLEAECDRVNNTGICNAQLVCNSNRIISVTVKSFLVRVVQEFIQNSLKHADCTRIDVQVTDGNQQLLITVSDNGKGFDAKNVRSRGIGLKNMQRRVEDIGGLFNLQAEPGRGTLLEISIPEKNLGTA